MLPSALSNRVRPRRRNEAARPSNEQWIVERLAKATQCLAHGRLRHAKPTCRTARVQLLVECDDDGKQIQIDALLNDHLRRPAALDLLTSSQRSCLAKNAKISAWCDAMTLP